MWQLDDALFTVVWQVKIQEIKFITTKRAYNAKFHDQVRFHKHVPYLPTYNHIHVYSIMTSANSARFKLFRNNSKDGTLYIPISILKSRVWIMCELGPVASWQQWVNTGWYACFSVPLVFDRANYAVAHKWQHSHFVCMWYWFNIHNQYRSNSFRKQSWKGSIKWICYLSGLFSYQVWMSMRFNHGRVGIIMGHFRNKIASVML